MLSRVAAEEEEIGAQTGQLRGPNGRFISTGNPPPRYDRSQYPGNYRAGVRDAVLDANTETEGPNAGLVRTVNDEYVARDDPRITIEHNSPVVEHWNSTGYNSSQAVRNDWYNDTSNMSIMLKADASAQGGRMVQQGIRYRQDIGPNYSR
jgi:hypothetical protein